MAVVDLAQDALTKNALEVLHTRPYLQPGESVDEMWERIAVHVAGAESPEDQTEMAKRFFLIMSSLRFIPNSPTVAHAGVPGSTHCLSACFVDSPDDDLDSIIRVGAITPKIENSGGGIGWGLSRIRPENDKVGSKPDGACGPIRVLHWYSQAGNMFSQGQIRQGAHMAQLHVSHPDILDFIHAKDGCLTPQDPLANVNISVQLTDGFMEAVKGGAGWHFINPRTNEWTGRIVPAKDIWDAICESAWRTGDPGVVFMDRVHESAPNPHLGPIQSSNPCGEEFLEDGGSCNLGSMNLAKYVQASPGLCDHPGRTCTEAMHLRGVDWASLKDDIHVAVRFLDNVIDVNQFPFEYLAEMNLKTRRIGLGVMGWADMLVLLGLKYDSQEALDLATKLSAFIATTAWEASCALGEEKGQLDHMSFRNSSVTTIAPTGSISIIAGCSSGIEPHFDLFWTRQSMWGADGKSSVELIECPAPLRAELERHEYDVTERDIGLLDTSLYRTSHQITPEWHVRMQAAWQSSVTNGVSKTVNMPNSAAVMDISQALMLAWELKCKAVTVYRDGSKQQVLTSSSNPGIVVPDDGVGMSRPRIVKGHTVKADTGHGGWFFTINRVDGKPIEVFMTPADKNPCVRAGAEITGILVSVALQAGVNPEDLIGYLKGIDCGHPHWQDAHLVTSVYDALAMAMEEEFDPVEWTKLPGTREHRAVFGMEIHEQCPKCSHVSAVHRGGCLQCLDCGYNSCGG